MGFPLWRWPLTWGTRARARVPTVLQMEAVECGAASLAMVLAHHGRFVPLEELRLVCGVSRDGSKATNILRAAQSYGLDAKGYRREPSELTALPLPMIVHWSFNHFVVLEGYDARRWFLNDPAAGPRTVTHQEFDQSFTGVTLTFQPTETFQRSARPSGLVSALRARSAGAATPLAYVTLAGLLLVLPGLVGPTFIRIFVDDILINGRDDWAHPLTLAMIATALVAATLTGLQQHYLLKLETKFSLSTSSKFVWHLLRLPITFFIQRYPGELGNRVAMNDRVAQLLSSELAAMALSIFTAIFYLALMLRYDLALSALAVVTTLASVATVRWSSRTRATLNRRLLQDQGRLLGVAMSGLQSMETLKAMGMESDFFARWAGYQAKVLAAQQQLKLQTEILAALPPFLTAVTVTLILGLGAQHVIDGRMTIGTLVAFQTLVTAFAAPVQRLSDFGNALQEVASNLDRLDDAQKTPVDRGSRDAPLDEQAAKLAGGLALRDVVFGYSPLDTPLLNGISLQVRPGERIALVGGSGSGKSTIARLVCGLYQPWSGAVLIDGTPRDELSHRRLSQSFAVVDQDVFLFEGTVKDNLTLWDRTVPERDLTRAATDACIHDEIMQRPGGYDALVEEGGRNFSGGQRQRLEIARALVRNPTLLVLDEATSALDPATEKRFEDNMRRRGCTCLLIAHRLSTIRDCDEIVVLDRGRIAQRGTHEGMRRQAGPYSRLIAAEEA